MEYLPVHGKASGPGVRGSLFVHAATRRRGVFSTVAAPSSDHVHSALAPARRPCMPVRATVSTLQLAGSAGARVRVRVLTHVDALICCCRAGRVHAAFHVAER